MPYERELQKLMRAKKILSLLPRRLRPRAAMLLYDYKRPDLAGIDITVPLQHMDLQCRINTKDLIGWELFFFGAYEPTTDHVLIQHVKTGDVVLEAGCHVGTETLLLAKLVGDEGHVYGFEPHPHSYSMLCDNIALNGLANVTAHNAAVGEASGDVRFNIFPQGHHNPGRSGRSVITDETREIVVQQYTIDAFVAENGIKRVDLLKMDIQGSEPDALKGAAATIATHRPMIYTEAIQKYADTGALYEAITAYGYTIYLARDKALMPIRSAAEVQNGNWLCRYER
ncbi:hypothetical protein GCM10023093_09260 [Nemorincola caseinilytica]|uniref:Methyltransferase FkbM domain-containing protein n=2 Tax=Nemorincola caseinilytica TaxID=2054315 RepID=A0ABP8NAU6_9BACT